MLELTHDVDRYPAQEVSNHNQCHLAGCSHFTFLLLTTCSLARCLDDVEDVGVHQEYEHECNEVQSMKDCNRIFPAWYSLISQMD